MYSIPRYLFKPLFLIKYNRPSVMLSERDFRNCLSNFILNGVQAIFVEIILPPKVQPNYHCAHTLALSCKIFYNGLKISH